MTDIDEFESKLKLSEGNKPVDEKALKVIDLSKLSKHIDKDNLMHAR